MKAFVTGLFVAIALSASAAQAREEAVYVGEGRFVGEDRTSSDTSVLRQRNKERTTRAQERDRDEQRYERAGRREREYDREYSDRY